MQETPAWIVNEVKLEVVQWEDVDLPAVVTRDGPAGGQA